MSISEQEDLKRMEPSARQQNGGDELSVLDDAIDAVERDRERLRTALAEGIEERERLLNELDSAESEIAAVKAERDEFKRALDELIDDQDELRDALQETERWLRRLEQSRSWRMMRPLRWLGGVLRRVRVRWRTRGRRGA